ncbi:hypothetical protein Bbelb_019020 [Branchiostoma belcheri]|nr:hypothetical protein Bbelb_019020 [Branchiostoma belcheri]
MLQTAGSTEAVDLVLKLSRGEASLGCPDAAATLQKLTPVLLRTPSTLSFFPGLPQKIGLPKYVADTKPSGNSTGSCLKESNGHPSLTPGIFNMFCRHGVCYGFDCMTSCESPRHPFEIFRNRFNTSPDVIVYDNAYRFHFRGHIGCSLGYCMDEYRQSVDIASINSQVPSQKDSHLEDVLEDDEDGERVMKQYQQVDNLTAELKRQREVKRASETGTNTAKSDGSGGVQLAQREAEQPMRERLKTIEGTRHLVAWEDGATLANHAIHLTDEEYHQKFNPRLSVQSAVEQPRIYIIARSKSSDAEQLLYAKTRRDYLHVPSLALPVKAPNGSEYHRDILRFSKGDSPSQQFELGQQRVDWTVALRRAMESCVMYVGENPATYFKPLAAVQPTPTNEPTVRRTTASRPPDQLRQAD